MRHTATNPVLKPLAGVPRSRENAPPQADGFPFYRRCLSKFFEAGKVAFLCRLFRQTGSIELRGERLKNGM